MTTRKSRGTRDDLVGPDYVWEWMKENDIRLTRKNYLELAYWTPNPDLDAEAEAALPAKIRKRPRRTKS